MFIILDIDRICQFRHDHLRGIMEHRTKRNGFRCPQLFAKKKKYSLSDNWAGVRIVWIEFCPVKVTRCKAACILRRNRENFHRYDRVTSARIFSLRYVHPRRSKMKSQKGADQQKRKKREEKRIEDRKIKEDATQDRTQWEIPTFVMKKSIDRRSFWFLCVSFYETILLERVPRRTNTVSDLQAIFDSNHRVYTSGTCVPCVNFFFFTLFTIISSLDINQNSRKDVVSLCNTIENITKDIIYVYIHNSVKRLEIVNSLKINFYQRT